MSYFLGQTIESAWRNAYTALPGDAHFAMLVSQVLLAQALKKDRAYLHAYSDHSLPDEVMHAYDALLLRYKAGEPLAYLCGETEFYSFNFIVNQHVLVPRPETEKLVDEAAAVLRVLQPEASVLDMGTGSGAIAISLAKLFPNTKITALDVSEEALVVARLNAEKNACQQIEFIQSHWFDALPKTLFDCIVSNPPYLRFDEWQYSQPLHAEPAHALIGSGDDGLGAYREIAHGARTYLKENGTLMFEHGYTQAEAVRDILQQAGYCDVFSVYDLLGHERVTYASWREAAASQRPLLCSV